MLRRSTLCLLLAGLVLNCKSSAVRTEARLEDAGGYGRPTVFARGQGEHRMMGGTRPLFIVADSATVGSRTLVAGYEEVTPGDSGRTHMHLEEDEIIFVHRGELELLLTDSTHRARAGATIFIPRRTWIKFQAVGADTAGFFFVFNAPAFEKCLRALSVRPGERFMPLDKETIGRMAHECHYVRKER